MESAKFFGVSSTGEETMASSPVLEIPKNLALAAVVGNKKLLINNLQLDCKVWRVQ